MTRKIFAAVLISLSATVTSAQEGGDFKEAPAHVGLVYPLSTNGTEAYNFKNKFSLHAIAGVSASEESFCASGFANVVRYNANGLIASGFANVILENATGLQASGINYIGQYAKGFQAAGFANITGRSLGLQGAGFANVNTDDVQGGQLAGFANVAKDVEGFQGAGFANVAKDVKGAQASGFVNVARKVKGAQVSGYVNVAESVNTQVSGFINIAGEVKGAQVSGFINIADSCAFPVGFVNISRKGEKFIGVTMDDNLTTMVAFRSGGKYLYGIVGAGANLSYTDPLYAIEAGLGAHIPIAKSFRFNVEATATSLSDFWTTAKFTSAFRVLPALKLGKRFEIFAGPVLNYESSDNFNYEETRTNYLWKSNDFGYRQRLYIGAIGGLHFDI